MEEEPKKVEPQSYDSKIKAISGKLAANKYNLYHGKNINFQNLIDENDAEVRKKIANIKTEIAEKFSGITLPKEIEYIIADYMLMNISSEITEVTQVAQGEKFSTDVFEKVILPNVDADELKRYQEEKNPSAAINFKHNEMNNDESEAKGQTEEITNDIKTGKDWKFRNSEFGKWFSKEAGTSGIEDLEVSERKLVDVIDKNKENINKLIKQADSGDPESSKRAKTILSVASTVIGFSGIEKEYSNCDSIEKQNAICSIYNLGRVVNETGDEYSTELIESFLDTLQLKDILEKTEDGKTHVNIQKIQNLAQKEGVGLGDISSEIMKEEHWSDRFVNYTSADDYLVESMIQTSNLMMNAETCVLFLTLKSGDITLEESKQCIKKILSKNIDAANRNLATVRSCCSENLEGEEKELYNFIVQTTFQQYLNAPEGYVIDNYVMKDLLEGVNQVERDGELDSKTLQLVEQVVQKNITMIRNSQGNVKYEDELYEEHQDVENRLDERIYNELVFDMQQMSKENNGQEKIHDFVLDTFDSKFTNKERLIKATLEYLEGQKDTEEFLLEDEKDFRKELYEEIVLSGMNNPEIFERMRNLDRDTSKIVVESMIEQVNSSRTMLNNVVGAIQELGKNLNEPIQEQIVEDMQIGFLDVEKADLPYVKLLPDDDEGR